MSEYVTKINHCRCCKNENLITLMDLGEQALSSRFPKADEPDVFKTPLVLVKCDDRNSNACGLIQLLHNTSQDELYMNNYGYRSGLNASMVKHLGELIKEIENRIVLNDGDVVLEIGGNDSTSAKAYSNMNLKRYVIDPTGTQFKQYYPDYITLIPDYFTKTVYDQHIKEKAKVITTICMLYDLPDLESFVQDVKDCLADDGVWVSEQSYAITMFENNSFDTIVAEHLEYYCLKQIQYICDKVGLEIIDVSLNNCNGGSFRLTIAHPGKYPVLSSVSKLRQQEDALDISNLQPIYDFITRVEKLKEELVSFLKAEKAKGKTIYLLSCSTKGNCLLNYYGLDPTIITAGAEINPNKFGSFTPGSRIPIISDVQMREEKPDYLLCLAWHFKASFLLREEEYIKNGGQMIFPLPTFEIYSK